MQSQNGWPAGTSSEIPLVGITVPGTKTKMPVRAGDVATVLQWVATRWHNEIEPLVESGNWGYAYRDIRGATTLSNHASGTAIDLNAPAHPLGTEPLATLSKEQVATAKRIEADTGGVVRWGGSYTGRKDAMHWEINAGPAAVAEFAARIQGTNAPSEEDDMTPEQAAQLDRIEKRLLGADVDKRGYDMLQSIEAAAGDAQNRIRGTHPAMDSLQTIQWQVAQVAAALATQRVDVDEKALADQILAGLVPQVVAAVGQQAGLTAEQIADITERVVRGVFADAGS